MTIDPTKQVQDCLPTIRQLAQLKDDLSLITIIQNGTVIVIQLTNADGWLLLNAAASGKLIQGKVTVVVIPGLSTEDVYKNFTPSD